MRFYNNNKMTQNYFTSDTHFGHENIIKYTSRPFKNIEEMDKTLINNWNSRVKPSDNVFFIGDFCFKNTDTNNKSRDYIQKLNGNIIFIRGNHDYNNGLNTHIHGLIIEMSNKLIYLVHRPEDYEPSFPINFVGHVHEKWKFKKLPDGVFLINVGVDQWRFMPVTYNEIMKEFNKWKKENGI